MLAIGGRALADIYGHVQHSATYTTHELALREGRALEMEATHDAVGGHTLVVLHEKTPPAPLRRGEAYQREYFLFKFSLRETLEEIATGVAEDAGLYDDDAVDGGSDYVHNYLF